MAWRDLLNSVLEKQPPEKLVQMYLRQAGNGVAVHYELTSRPTVSVEWVSAETDQNEVPAAVRMPEERSREYSRKLPFSVAGKNYSDLNHFLRKLDDEWGEDIYGRAVFCVRELYPCFDSADYLHENRYYRWFFIREGNSVSRLFISDDRDKIYVTEDVRNVETEVWSRMKEVGFCQNPQREN